MFNPVTIRSDNDKDEETGLYSLEIVITFSNFQIYHKFMKIMVLQNYVSQKLV